MVHSKRSVGTLQASSLFGKQGSHLLNITPCFNLVVLPPGTQKAVNVLKLMYTIQL